MEQLNFFNTLDDKVKPKKVKVKFIKDSKYLHDDFIIDAVFDLFMEQKNHYVIFHNDVFYHPFKTSCIKLEDRE